MNSSLPHHAPLSEGPAVLARARGGTGR
jgi:hypothetical protein